MRYYSEGGLDLRYGTESSAGIDLPFYDAEMETVVLQPGETKLIKTGIHMEIPDMHVGFLDTRSSTGKAGVDLMCRTIDWDYRGNIRLMVINHGGEPLTIERGQFIAQIVIMKLNEDRKLERVSSPDELSKTDRGDKGFGSTGGGLAEESKVFNLDSLPMSVRMAVQFLAKNTRAESVHAELTEVEAFFMESNRSAVSHVIGSAIGGETRLHLSNNKVLTIKRVKNDKE